MENFKSMFYLYNLMKAVLIFISTLALLVDILGFSYYPLWSIVVLILLFSMAALGLLLKSRIFQFLNVIFYSWSLVIAIPGLLSEGFKALILVSVLINAIGLITAITLKSRKEVNAKLTDFFEKKKTIKKELPEEAIKEVIILKPKIFASKHSRIYHIEGCKIGERIKEENRIYFKSEAQARRKGYKRHKL